MLADQFSLFHDDIEGCAAPNLDLEQRNQDQMMPEVENIHDFDFEKFQNDYESVLVSGNQSQPEHDAVDIPAVTKNRVFKSLFLNDQGSIDALYGPNSQEDIGANDVNDFFLQGKNKNSYPTASDGHQNGQNRSSTDNLTHSDRNEVEGASFDNDDSMFNKGPKDIQKVKEGQDRYREKKRLKKMKQKVPKKVSFDGDLATGSNSPSAGKASSIDEADSCTPQKRKGTIWKILFPQEKTETEGTELQRLVCRQVEDQISKNSKVIQICEQLKNLENSEEGKSMLKDEFTKKKNRISAQLSRERRGAILHSLINVCIENIKAKKQYEADLIEVKQILKDTLCDPCTKNLINIAEESKRPSTINKPVSKNKPIRGRKTTPAVTVAGGGAVKMMMTIFGLAVIACIAGVTLAPQAQPTSFISMNGDMSSDASKLETSSLRLLGADTYNCDMEEWAKPKSLSDGLEIQFEDDPIISDKEQLERLLGWVLEWVWLLGFKHVVWVHAKLVKIDYCQNLMGLYQTSYLRLYV